MGIQTISPHKAQSLSSTTRYDSSHLTDLYFNPRYPVLPCPVLLVAFQQFSTTARSETPNNAVGPAFLNTTHISYRSFVLFVPFTFTHAHRHFQGIPLHTYISAERRFPSSPSPLCHHLACLHSDAPLCIQSASRFPSPAILVPVPVSVPVSC